MLLACDGENGCKKEFRITEFKSSKLENDIEKTYFQCPHCNKEFISFYTDKQIRWKQQKIRKRKTLSKINELKEEIAQDMKVLREKIEASH